MHALCGAKNLTPGPLPKREGVTDEVASVKTVEQTFALAQEVRPEFTPFPL
jgi:hypothetical protein